MQEITSGKISYRSSTRLNDKQYINKYLEALNSQLEMGESIEVFFESKDQRRIRILNEFLFPFSYLYYAIDFTLNRVFPKLGVTQKIYYWITKGRNRVLSKTEILGRLVYCGFKILHSENRGNSTFVWAEKFREPKYNENPTYGALIRLNRVGYGGISFIVYKLRTMHPYAEYIQEYIYEHNNLREGGKFADDFRITSYGSWMRKLWIDELPMLYNLLKGEMKIVGVRPLSKHYFSLYPPDVQALRNRVRPGLIPPFYADLPKSLDEIIESERKYLQLYINNPNATDWRYFWKAFKNIVFKKNLSN
jgi:lipopolysaccharide/colanic/teichoic acid biosynthesis glycosyltransferase